MKKITKLVMTMWALICMVQIVSAQNKSTIQGVVTDVNGNPLIGASVSLFKNKDSIKMQTTLTNEKGNFQLMAMPEMDYTIVFSNVGYEKQSLFITLKNGQKFICDTSKLEIVQKQLDAVVINVKKTNFIETKLDRTILNVDASPNAAGASVFEVLEKSPGISSDKNGNLSMQGKTGLQVLIDGRPTYMSNTDLTNLLKSMQSNEVQTIELIANPSSKYDAAGNGGIINIKTKKSKNYGTNGTLTTGVGYGDYLKANGGLSLNNRSEKLNLFGNYNYSYNKNGRTLSIDREIIKNNIPTFFSQDGIQRNENNTHYFKIGADYNLGKNSIIGFLINGNENYQNQHFVNTTLMSDKKTFVDSSLFTDNNFNQEYHNRSYNLNFKTNLNQKGDELSIDADYSKYNSQVNSFFNNFYFDAANGKLKDPLFTKSATNSDITIKSIKEDYVNQFSNSLKLEAGTKITMIKSDNSLNYYQLNGTAWQNDASKTNHFIYDENVWAAYANASKKWDNTSIQIGLRAEYSDTKGNSLTENKIVKRDYLDFFPSVFVNHKFSKNHNLGFSYSRRIQRPDYESLNPFVYVIDEFTYQKGNPFLNPEYNQSFELTYLLNNKYMVQLGYTHTKDVIADVILVDSSKKSLYQTSKNIDQQNSYRLTISAPFKITKWWRVTSNLNGIQMNLSSPDLEGKQLDASQFFVMVNSNHNFKLNNGLNIELTAKYNSPLIFGTLKVQSEFSMDAGLSKSILNNRGNLKLSLSDFLNTKNQKISSVYPGVNYALVQKHETRIFRLSFTYNFGNKNVKESRNKKTGLEEEQNRLKSK